jgi:hypothetical protein
LEILLLVIYFYFHLADILGFADLAPHPCVGCDLELNPWLLRRLPEASIVIGQVFFAGRPIVSWGAASMGGDDP